MVVVDRFREVEEKKVEPVVKMFEAKTALSFRLFKVEVELELEVEVRLIKNVEFKS
jgi:hypothetical protein